MLTKQFLARGLACAMTLLTEMPPMVFAQQVGQAPAFKQEELEQIPVFQFPISSIPEP